MLTYGIAIYTMFAAARLKIAIMKGMSIPDFFKANPGLHKLLPKPDLDYIKSQGKKMLLAIQRRANEKKDKR